MFALRFQHLQTAFYIVNNAEITIDEGIIHIHITKQFHGISIFVCCIFRYSVIVSSCCVGLPHFRLGSIVVCAETVIASQQHSTRR